MVKRFSLEGLADAFEVIEIPGHTLDHIAYSVDGHLFCGDTLFSGGCGRIFEGTAKQMFDSLTLIKICLLILKFIQHMNIL